MNSNDFDNIHKYKLKNNSSSSLGIDLDLKCIEYTTKITYFYIMKNSSTLKA